MANLPCRDQVSLPCPPGRLVTTPPRMHQDLGSTRRDKKVDGGKECRMPRIARSERGAVSKKRPDSDFPCRIPGDGTLQKTPKSANGNFFRMPSSLLPLLLADRQGPWWAIGSAKFNVPDPVRASSGSRPRG